jgi:hypothetical protein
MTGALLTRPVSGQFELDGRGTLEELLGSAFDEARANGSTECPVCHARMVSARARGGAAAVGAAACGGCGSRLT